MLEITVFSDFTVKITIFLLNKNKNFIIVFYMSFNRYPVLPIPMRLNQILENFIFPWAKQFSFKKLVVFLLCKVQIKRFDLMRICFCLPIFVMKLYTLDTRFYSTFRYYINIILCLTIASRFMTLTGVFRFFDLKTSSSSGYFLWGNHDTFWNGVFVLRFIHT